MRIIWGLCCSLFLGRQKRVLGGGWHHAQLVPKPRCSMFNSLKIPAGWPTLVKTLIFSSWHFKLTLFGRHSSKIHDSKHIPPSIFNVAWVCLAGPGSLCEISAVSSDATVTAPPSSPFLIVIQLMRRKMSAGYSVCNLHAVFVADIWAEATQLVSLVLPTRGLQAGLMTWANSFVFAAVNLRGSAHLLQSLWSLAMACNSDEYSAVVFHVSLFHLELQENKKLRFAGQHRVIFTTKMFPVL